VVVVVSDQALRLVGCPPADILRHVHSSCVSVTSLDGVLAIATDSGDGVAEDEFLKSPFSAQQWAHM
jgi:hypothetical protein